MKVSIIIPSYNEIDTLPQVIKAVSELKIDKEIIVVDDGSADGTWDFLNQEIKSGKLRGIKALRHEKNKGKGQALITGFSAASGDVVAVQDADLEYPPSQIAELIRPIEVNEADFVFGSRMMFDNVATHSQIYLLGNRVMTALINFLFASHYSDAYTCYKIFRTKDIQRMNLKSKGFEIEAEMACKAAFMGLRFIELPIDYVPRSREAGKKINFIDALKGALKALYLRLSLRKDKFN